MNIFHAEDEGFCVGTQGCLVAAIWGREVVLADLHQIAEAQRRVSARYDHCASVTIIRAKPTLGVSAEIRTEAAKHLNEFARVNRGIAMVVESAGARAIFFRSILTSVYLLARTSTPQKVFTTIDDAVGWVLTRPGIDPATGAASKRITAAVHDLSNRYGANDY